MNTDLIKDLGIASVLDGLRDVSFTFSDSLDILLVAILIYAILKLIYETRSFPIIFGISTVLLLYGLATVLNLSVSRTILQSFLSVFIILMVIIFQNEFRRFLTYFNLAPYIARKRLPSENIISILSETIKYLAEKSMGALIVFPGKEAVDHHITGGYELDGEISEPLLLSIFDESTPGHDGAIILDGSRLKKFGTHLPLAKNMRPVEGFGTRHRAALGLSERSDALVIVVSEERGTISIALNGTLRTLQKREDLAAIIRKFYADKFPHRDSLYVLKLGLKSAMLIFTTVALSVLIWVYSNQNSPLVQKNFVVPLEFQNVPVELVVSDAVPEEVVVTLEARGGNFQSMNSGEIRVPLDLSNARTGWRQFLVDSDKVKVPFGFTVVKIDPQRASLLIVKKQEPVTPSVKARP